MKQISNFIKEGLKITSKTKVNSKIDRLARLMGCRNNVIETILDKYVDLNVFDKKMHKKMICTDFEALFMLAMMLVKDKCEISDILYLGTVHYSSNIGHSNPYDYSWYEELYDDDKDIDILDQIKIEYRNNEKVKNIFKEIFNFCKDNDLDNYKDFFNFYEELNQ